MKLFTDCWCTRLDKDSWAWATAAAATAVSLQFDELTTDCGGSSLGLICPNASRDRWTLSASETVVPAIVELAAGTKFGYEAPLL